MKMINWVRWLLATCVCASLWSTGSARYKFRPPQPQIYKKSWPVGPRISMGNSVHINLGPSSYKHGRPMQYKPTNYNRYPSQNPPRRPPTFAVLPSWKTQTMLGPLSNQGSLPQRGPVKEFHAMNKAIPEYRPSEPGTIAASSNRGQMDDDKGPIHTIPAPNLSPADKPYNIGSHNNYPSSSDYTSSFGGSGQQSVATNYAFGTSGTSLGPQRVTTSPTTSPSPTLHRYEVTETNEIGHHDYRTIQPTFFTPEFDVTRLSSFGGSGNQGNEMFGNHAGSNTGLIGTNVQFGQSNAPMQTNLRSSLHVGFPASAVQAAQPTLLPEQQTPDLHVGHPAPAGPPLSATQLYDLLNSFPQQFNEQYAAVSGQQQQQQVLQQQLDQLFQPAGSDTQFSQPQMHSFNYDEQSNKQQQQQQQQQQIFVGQDYASGRVTADYSLEPDARENVRKSNVPRQESGSSIYPSDNTENNIEYEDSSNRHGQSTYFTQVGENDGSLSSQFYTTLPSRDAAEKLAALAAAGNVNSHLIDQIRKQQATVQLNGESMPANHKDDHYDQEREHGNDDTRYQQHPRYVNRDKEEEKRNQHNEEEEKGQRQDEKIPLRIMVPDLQDYSEDLEHRPSRGDIDSTRGSREDYEYEDSEESQIPESSEDLGKHQLKDSGSQVVYRHQLDSEFGSRLGSKRN